MKEIGLVMHASQLGVTEDNIPAIADATVLLPTGYRSLNRNDVVTILQQSL